MKKELYEAERKLEMGQVGNALSRLKDAKRKVITTASKARNKLVTTHTKLRSDLDHQFQSVMDELDRVEQKDVKDLDRQIKYLERITGDLQKLMNNFSVKSLRVSPEKVHVPDEIKMSYSLHSYILPEAENSSGIDKLLGSVDSKKFACTIPVTGKGKRYLFWIKLE